MMFRRHRISPPQPQSGRPGGAGVNGSADLAIEEGWVDVGDFRTRYLAAGEGPPLVLLHGHGESSGSWRWVLPALARRHRVYVPDSPGAGGTTKIPTKPAPPAFYVDFLAGFLDALALDRVALAGASHGGNTALRLALASPDRVTSLCLAGSSGLGREINPILIGLTLPGSAEVAAAWLSSPFGAPQWVSLLASLTFAQPLLAPPEWLAEQYVLAQTPGHLNGVVACLRGELDLTGQREVLLDELPRLPMPTLITWGTNDMVVPSRHGTAAADRLKNGRLVMIPGGGHLSHVERPELFVAALEQFFTDQGGAH